MVGVPPIGAGGVQSCSNEGAINELGGILRDGRAELTESWLKRHAVARGAMIRVYAIINKLNQLPWLAFEAVLPSPTDPPPHPGLRLITEAYR